MDEVIDVSLDVLSGQAQRDARRSDDGARMRLLD